LGSKIGSDVRVTEGLETSSYPSLVWDGSGYGITWNWVYLYNNEVYFTRIRCCDDEDFDGYSECAGDSNDADRNIHPDAEEICDGLDNNSDGYIDEGCDNLCDNPEKYGSDVRVTNDSSTSYRPSLFWTGSEYGTCWHDNRDANAEIYFARLDSSGSKIGSDVRVTYDASGSYFPDLVWNGGDYAVSWDEYRDGNYEIYFARLSSSGSKIGSDVRVTGDASTSRSPSMIWSGVEYGISWEDNRNGDYEIYFTRIDSSGNKIGNDVRVSSAASSSYNPSLIWNGSEYGVCWEDLRDGNYEIYFARLDFLGNKIGSDARITNDMNSSYGSSLIWSGSEYGLAWNDSRDGNYEIYFVRLDSLGNKIGSDVRVTNHLDTSSYPSLVWTGGEYGIAWHDERDVAYEIYFVRLDSSGSKIGSDLRLTTDSADSRYVSLVWSGNEHAVAWRDDRDGNTELYFSRVRCCDDVDADRHTECEGDCNDNDDEVYPGAPELCDYKDNDCDGTIDEGYITPGGITGLAFATDKQTMNWDVEVNADYYDMVKGDLQTLISSGGNFTYSVTGCLENNDTDTLASDTDEPTLPGEGFYYLVRAQKQCRYGTYNTGQPTQVGDRDSEIDSSSNKCP
jgi:hypothetical protein